MTTWKGMCWTLIALTFVLAACAGRGSSDFTATGLTVEENLDRFGIPAQVVPFDHSVPRGLIVDPTERQAMLGAKLRHLQEVNKLFWGEAPGAVEDRQATFDEVWGAIDEVFPGFPGLELDWDEFYEVYLAKAAEAQSYGQYAYVMTLMGYLLREHHAFMVPSRLAEAERAGFWNSIDDGATVPALVLRRGNGTSAVSAIGACLTVTLEDELIIDRVWEGSPNPYQFASGDEVVGFNGVPWQNWVRRLETAGIPIIGSPGGAETARKYRLLRASMMNAHLFESINIRREATGEIETVDTVFIGPEDWRPCVEATAPASLVPADDTPRSESVEDEPMLVHGILPEENVGYMAIKRVLPGEMDSLHHPDALAFAGEFEEAVLSLMDTDGLIVDLRYNEGGRDIDIFFPGLAHLVEGSEERLIFEKAVRDEDSQDREALRELTSEHGPLQPDEPDLFYENPIIVLTGPDCKSSCDWLVQFMERFPEFTIIGRDPNASMMAYGIKSRTLPSGDDYVAMYVPAVALFDVEEQPLMHRSRRTGIVDEEVWFTREDVIKGVDTVAERALELIDEARTNGE